MGTESVTGISVIVRADRDEPVQLRAIGTARQDVVVVAGSDDTKAIGFPADLVFELDESLLRRLRAAFEAGDEVKLRRQWEKARHFDAAKLTSELGHSA